MAFLDNPAILLAHIRQAHITSDDTGMCEMVLIDHDVEGGCISSGQYGPGGLSRSCPPFGPDSRRLSPASPASPGSPASVCSFASLISSGGRSECEAPVLEHSQSVDITSGWDFGIRPRSNTAQRLERLRKERQNQVKCKNIPWKDRGTRQSSEEQALLFDKKDFRTKRAEAAATGAATSLLSMRLEKCPHQLNNPFNEFSKFDGKVSPRADDLGPPSGPPSGPHFEHPSGPPSGPSSGFHFEPPSGPPSGPSSGSHFEPPLGPSFESPSVSSGCKYEPDDGTWEFPFDI